MNDEDFTETLELDLRAVRKERDQLKARVVELEKEGQKLVQEWHDQRLKITHLESALKEAKVAFEKMRWVEFNYYQGSSHWQLDMANQERDALFATINKVLENQKP